MISFRKILLQRIALAAFLLAGLLVQAQVVFACDLMGGARQAQCCCGDELTTGCEMGGGCAALNQVQDNADCCVISVDAASESATTVTVSQNPSINLLNGPQPPPIALLATNDNKSSLPRTATTNFIISYSAPIRANIYLSTRRIRI